MFERYAISKQRNWKRRALIIGSLALHGGVVAFLVVGSWFHVSELTPPMLAIVFVSAPTPAQQQAPEARPKRPSPSHAAVKTHPSLTMPSPTPQTAPTLPDTSSTDPSGPPDGPPGDPGDHGPGTTPGNPCPPGANCVTAPAPKPRNVAPHALDAQRIAGVMPHLPASVAGAHRGLGDSTFTARLCVDTSGNVSSVTVLGGIPGADGEITAALRAWRYRPQALPVCFITQLVYNVE